MKPSKQMQKWTSFGNITATSESTRRILNPQLCHWLHVFNAIGGKKNKTILCVDRLNKYTPSARAQVVALITAMSYSRLKYGGFEES